MLFLKLNAQLAADAENEDNVSEQRRQHGKRVRYGEVIQVSRRFMRSSLASFWREPEISFFGENLKFLQNDYD